MCVLQLPSFFQLLTSCSGEFMLYKNPAKIRPEAYVHDVKA